MTNPKPEPAAAPDRLGAPGLDHGMDWEQVRQNGGPPCFHDVGKGRLCGRAKRWPGHPEDHPYVSLEAYARAALSRGPFEPNLQAETVTLLSNIRREMLDLMPRYRCGDLQGKDVEADFGSMLVRIDGMLCRYEDDALSRGPQVPHDAEKAFENFEHRDACLAGEEDAIIAFAEEYAERHGSDGWYQGKKWAEARAGSLPQPLPQPRPKIICLCGSTRFTEQMCSKSWELAKQGVIALGWNVLLGAAAFANGAESHGAEAEGVKEQIDELHKRKIDLSDEVFVLNIGGYIGNSTRSEIDYAEAHGKPVRYLEAAAPIPQPPPPE